MYLLSRSKAGEGESLQTIHNGVMHFALTNVHQWAEQEYKSLFWVKRCPFIFVMHICYFLDHTP
jgi:hypothetical protein